MKNQILILSFLLFFSCQENKLTEEEKMANLTTDKVLCGNLVHSINGQIMNAEQIVRKSGYHKSDAKIIKKMENLAVLKNKYLDKQNKTNLLNYSKSIFQSYLQEKNTGQNIYNGIRSHLSWDNKDTTSSSKLNFKDLVVKRMNAYLETNDTLDHIQLFLWTLKAEENLLNHYSQFIGDTRISYNVYIQGLANSRNLVLGDTMFFIMEPTPNSECFNKPLIFKPGKIYFQYEKTNSRTFLKPIKIGQKYLLRVIPKQTGNYDLVGRLILDSLDTSTGRDCTFVMKYPFQVN